MKSKQYHIYILTNRRHTVLYIGITGDLITRIWQHKQKMINGFTKKYNITKLIYFEEHQSAYAAISREKQLKGWTRKKKESVINTFNPKWKDLYKEIC